MMKSVRHESPAQRICQLENLESHMIKSKQAGFTLIELVVVIVILGILAAFAVPRFMGLEGEARASTVKNMAGTLMSAASMARAKCQAQSCGAAGQVNIEGTNVRMVAGYPNRAGIISTLQSTEGFTRSNQGTTAVRFLKAGGGANCWVQYNQAVAPNPPTITYGVSVPITSNNFNRELSDACG
jgi:MSHA pilin protein MshA